MSRIVDEPYFTYSAYDALTSGIQVKCPKCHGTGVVTADEDNAYFRCLSCGHQVARDRTIYRYDVHNQCKNCGRYYRVDIEDEERQHFSVLHVACPYCGTTMPGEVHKTAEAFSYIGEIRDGREPYFGLELWFLTSFQGKPVWALNREHLAYLIGYLSADLREKPPGRAKMTQADHLPTSMKPQEPGADREATEANAGEMKMEQKVIYNGQILTLTRFWATGEPCLWITDPQQIGMPKMEFVGGHPDEYCIFLKNLTETELSQITSLDGAPLDVKEERNDIE